MRVPQCLLTQTRCKQLSIRNLIGLKMRIVPNYAIAGYFAARPANIHLV